MKLPKSIANGWYPCCARLGNFCTAADSTPRSVLRTIVLTPQLAACIVYAGKQVLGWKLLSKVRVIYHFGGGLQLGVRPPHLTL